MNPLLSNPPVDVLQSNPVVVDPVIAPIAQADDSSIHRIVWKRDNGRGFPITFHCLETVIAPDADTAQERADERFPDLKGQIVTVPQSIFEDALAEARVAAETLAEEQRLEDQVIHEEAVKKLNAEKAAADADLQRAQQAAADKAASALVAARQRLGLAK